MKIFCGNSFAEVYKDVLLTTINTPDCIVSPNGSKTYELLNVAIEISNPKENFFFNRIQSPSTRYLAGELVWYLSGNNSLAFIRNYSKFWDKIACLDGTCNSAYGYLLFKETNEHDFSEWGWALQSLRNDEHTRQAIIRFNKPRFSYIGNKDFVCTLNGHFMIRNNKLNLIIFMRANDLRRGIQYDIPFFTTLQYIMYKQLVKTYKNLELGTYTHFVSSMHLYEEDINKSKEALNYEYVSQSIPMPNVLIPISDHGRSIKEYIDLSCGHIHDDINDDLYCWIKETMQGV